MLDIQKVTTEGPALESIKSLFKAYLGELNEDLCFQSFDSEIDNPLYKYSAPVGALFIAYYNATPVGCIALQPLQEAQTCEMKRLYVAPDYRKLGVGDALVKILLQEAQSLGYAEADPTFDVEGFDTAHKLSILAAIAIPAYQDYTERAQSALESSYDEADSAEAAAASLAAGSKYTPSFSRIGWASASTSIRCEMGDPW